MAEHTEIFLGPGAKGDPYNPGPVQRGDVTVPEPVTDAPVEVPGQLFGADAVAEAASAPADPAPNPFSSSIVDDEHDDDEVT